ncbi:MAG TPA: hypothetical protein VKD21_13155 [Acidimicrobiales bacterium]|nr:hypothetical protein [Acidimicrobiales bacterium]
MADADIDTGPGSDQPDRGSEPLISAEGLAGITRALGWLLAIAAAGLAATGVPLIFLYRPDGVDWLRAAHSVASTLFLGAAAGTVAVLGVGAVRRLRIPPGWLVALGLLAIAMLGLVSGQLIAWDRLAMDEVVDASGVRGVFDALSGDVRAVVVDGSELSRGAYAAWAGVHVLAVPVLVLGVGWFVRRRARSH